MFPLTLASPIVAMALHELSPAGTTDNLIGLGLTFDRQPAMAQDQVSTAHLSLLPSPESDMQANPTVVHEVSHHRSNEEPEVMSSGSLRFDSAMSPREVSDAEDRPMSGSEGKFYSLARPPLLSPQSSNFPIPLWIWMMMMRMSSLNSQHTGTCHHSKQYPLWSYLTQGHPRPCSNMKSCQELLYFL